MASNINFPTLLTVQKLRRSPNNKYFEEVKSREFCLIFTFPLLFVIIFAYSFQCRQYKSYQSSSSCGSCQVIQGRKYSEFVVFFISHHLSFSFIKYLEPLFAQNISVNKYSQVNCYYQHLRRRQRHTDNLEFPSFCFVSTIKLHVSFKTSCTCFPFLFPIYSHYFSFTQSATSLYSQM